MRSTRLMRVALLTVIVAIGTPVVAQTPGSLTNNQIIAQFNEALANNNQNYEAAGYEVTRANPGQEQKVTTALALSLDSAQLQAAGQGVNRGIGDGVGTGQISGPAGVALRNFVTRVANPTGPPLGGFSFPSGDPGTQGFTPSPSGGVGGAAATPVATS